MAKATFDVPTDVLREATRVLYAGVGANDRAVEVVRGLVTTASQSAQRTVAGVQRNVGSVDLSPRSLRKAIETRVVELQDGAKAYPAKVQARVTGLVDENVAAYGDLVKRGETLVGRIRRQQSTTEAATAARTTVTKARTTRTQAGGTATATRTATKSAARSAAKKSTAPRKKAATTRSSAKATATAARRTAAGTARAVADAAEKVGD